MAASSSNGAVHGGIAFGVGVLLAALAIPVVTTQVLTEKPEQADQSQLVVYGE